jgi:hypothetical protein
MHKQIKQTDVPLRRIEAVSTMPTPEAVAQPSRASVMAQWLPMASNKPITAK